MSGVYYLVPSILIEWGGVTAMDILKYKKHIACMPDFLLTGLHLKSGDVVGDNMLSALDLVYIRNRIGDPENINSFPAGDWAFNTDTITLSNNDDINFNIFAICYGDASGSYLPYSKRDMCKINFNTTDNIIVLEAEDNLEFELPIKTKTSISNL